MNDPADRPRRSAAALAVLRRIQQPRPVPPPGRAMRPVYGADSGRARPSGGSAGPELAVRLPGLLSAVHVERCGRRALPGGAGSLPCVCRTSQLSTGRSGIHSRFPSGWRSSSINSALDRVAAFYPGPAGATESELALDRWADVVAANPVLETLEPDVEALLVASARPRRRSGGVLHRAHRRLLRAGRPFAPAVAGLRWRSGGPGRDGRASSNGCGPGPGPDDDLAFEVIDARAEPHAAAPTIMLRGGSTNRRRHRARPGAAGPDQDRTPAAPLPARRGRTAVRAVRGAGRVGRLARVRFCGPT